MSRPRWTATDMPPLTDKTIVVTGASSGLGLAASEAFARAGAHVILACRSEPAATAAMATIRAAHPAASLEFLPLDLASLASVRAFAAAFGRTHQRLDILCNNAGVMALPPRKTADGFEMQLGTNHLGHFALTGLLLDALIRAAPSRVVVTSSGAHKMGNGRMNFDDLQSERGYGKWKAYQQSKLANLLFAYELQRRLAGKGLAVRAVACHPGYTATHLQLAGPEMEQSGFGKWIMRVSNRLIAQPIETGVLPMLYAATAPDVAGGDYIGPDGLGERAGYPKKVASSAASHDAAAALRLWEVSQQLTGVHYAI